jgi:hypothetical protein
MLALKLALVVILIWLSVLVETRTDKLTDNAWTVKLVGHCHLDYHTPAQAVALACPEVDYIRLWPLPVGSRGGSQSHYQTRGPVRMLRDRPRKVRGF